MKQQQQQQQKLPKQMSFGVLIVLYLTSDPSHPRLGGRWPVTPAWAFLLSALTALMAAWIVPTQRGGDRRFANGGFSGNNPV